MVSTAKGCSESAITQVKLLHRTGCFSLESSMLLSDFPLEAQSTYPTSPTFPACLSPPAPSPGPVWGLCLLKAPKQCVTSLRDPSLLSPPTYPLPWLHSPTGGCSVRGSSRLLQPPCLPVLGRSHPILQACPPTVPYRPVLLRTLRPRPLRVPHPAFDSSPPSCTPAGL